MKPYEKFISAGSDYYVYTPSVVAQEMYFYPLYTGRFIYEKGYSLYRHSYDSFLIMYVEKGSLTVEFEGKKKEVNEGEFIFLDCYKPHAYYSDVGWESIWCHFDGVLARRYYSTVVSHLGNSFSLNDSYAVTNKLNAIYNIFSNGELIREALLSKYLSDILIYLILYTPIQIKSYDHSGMIEEIISYINEHFSKNITIEELAEIAKISPYHFIRIFKKETGTTPHEYIINTRINTAKYMLKNSKLSIKDICFDIGFSSESTFCSSFKKNTGITPTDYRNSSINPC